MENQHLVTVNSFVEALYAAGVHHVCISPGSRSTPLTMAIARQQKMRIWSLLDERSAGFFAVGLARAAQAPIALICTSGTATANYYPAVMEARQARLPLIVLTADRPAELRHVGSNQTVDQVKMYGDSVKWQVELPVPDGSEALTAHAVVMAWRAVSAAMTAPQGPVHMNLPFREPLIPPYHDVEQETDVLVHRVEQKRTWFQGRSRLAGDALQYAKSILEAAKRPLVVCGPVGEKGVAEAVFELATCLRAPVFADVLSQLRTLGAEKNNSPVVASYDVWLNERHRLSLPDPDCIIRFGGTPTSKALGQYMKEHREVRQLVIDVASSWRDPFYTATDVFQCDPVYFCRDVCQDLNSNYESGWLEYWQGIDRTAGEIITRCFKEERWHEAGVIAQLQTLLPNGSAVFAGNSMPIRDFDAFLSCTPKHLRFYANRGVSGIDGVVSSAMGVSAAGACPTVLVIGDVSFYHDLNGLLPAKRQALDLLIILIHNDGGGIFSFLPQAAYEDTFDQFRTSHGLDFEPVVKMYGGNFVRAHTWTQFHREVSEALTKGGLNVVEVSTDPSENVNWHKEVRQRVAKAVEGIVWENSSSESGV